MLEKKAKHITREKHCDNLMYNVYLIGSFISIYTYTGLPWWLSDQESAYRAEDVGSIPGWRRSPGEGHGNSSCLGNTTDRGAWQTTVHGISKSQTQLSD